MGAHRIYPAVGSVQMERRIGSNRAGAKAIKNLIMALDPQAEFAEYLKLSWKAFADGVAHAQTQLMTWLFTLQGAGVAGSLGYAASRGTPPSLIVSLIAFVFGILCLLMWG